MPLFGMAALRAREAEREVLGVLAKKGPTTLETATRIASESGVQDAGIRPLTVAILSIRGGISPRVEGRSREGEPIIVHEVTPLGQELIAGAKPPRLDMIRQMASNVMAAAFRR